MGALAFRSRDTIEETIQELDTLYNSILYEESHNGTAEWMALATQIIQQHKDRLIELANALATSSLEKTHRAIIDINMRLSECKDNKDKIDNRQLALKNLQDAIEKATGKPYEADEKLLRRVQLEKRLEYIEMELPYLARSKNSMYAPPETQYFFERYSREKILILEELKDM